MINRRAISEKISAVAFNGRPVLSMDHPVCRPLLDLTCRSEGTDMEFLREAVDVLEVALAFPNTNPHTVSIETE